MINHRKNWFCFKGVNSFEFSSIVVKELPAISKPARKVTQYDIAGRDGKLNILDEAYEPVVKQIQCGLRDLSEIDEITKWLNGSGKVTFSNQPDRFFYATIINQIDFERVARQFRNFVIQIECSPCSHSVDEDEAIELTSPSTILNGGNVKSQPIITVYGKGDCTLTVNEEVIKLKGIDGKITIDSSLMICHKDGTRVGRKMSGFFPELVAGENNIKWTGNITKVEIKTNSKFL